MAPPINATEKFFRELLVFMLAESTYGEMPSGSFIAMELKDVQPSFLAGDQIEREVARGYLGSNPSDLVNRRVELSATFDSWMQGVTRIDAGDPPPHSALFRCCGLAETITDPSATVPATATPEGSPTGAFTFTSGDPYQGVLDRTVTLECTTAGGSGTAAFKVTAPAQWHLPAVDKAPAVMTDGDPFDLIEGATITPTVGTDFAVGDRYTIALKAAGVTYTPVTSGVDSAYVRPFLGSDLHAMPGTRGGIGIQVQANNYLDMPVSLVGLVGPKSDTTPPTPDWSAFLTPKPVEYVRTPWFALGGDELVMDSLSFDSLTGAATLRSKVNQEKVVKASRDPSGTVTVQAPRLADRDYYTDIANSGARVPLTFVHGTARGETLVFEAPRAELRNPRESADNDGVAQMQMDVRLLPESGDDEFRIHLR
jgi:hypothetical protein